MKKKLALALSLLLVALVLVTACGPMEELIDQLPEEITDIIPGLKDKIPEGALEYTSAEDGTAVGADDKSLLPEELTIPAKAADGSYVEVIAANGFESCTGLKKITLPDNLRVIESYAFRDCTALTQINFPGLLVEVQPGAFSGCTALESITTPQNVIRIANGTFAGCAGLTTVIVSDNTVEIGEDAFNGCTALTHLTLPEALYSIGDDAFLDTALVEITYLGTTAQWAKVYRGTPENYAGITVHCLDGDVQY